MLFFHSVVAAVPARHSPHTPPYLTSPQIRTYVPFVEKKENGVMKGSMAGGGMCGQCMDLSTVTCRSAVRYSVGDGFGGGVYKSCLGAGNWLEWWVVRRLFAAFWMTRASKAGWLVVLLLLDFGVGTASVPGHM